MLFPSSRVKIFDCHQVGFHGFRNHFLAVWNYLTKIFALLQREDMEGFFSMPTLLWVVLETPPFHNFMPKRNTNICLSKRIYRVSQKKYFFVMREIQLLDNWYIGIIQMGIQKTKCSIFLMITSSRMIGGYLLGHWFESSRSILHTELPPDLKCEITTLKYKSDNFL